MGFIVSYRIFHSFIYTVSYTHLLLELVITKAIHAYFRKRKQFLTCSIPFVIMKSTTFTMWSHVSDFTFKTCSIHDVTTICEAIRGTPYK